MTAGCTAAQQRLLQQKRQDPGGTWCTCASLPGTPGCLTHTYPTTTHTGMPRCADNGSEEAGDDEPPAAADLALDAALQAYDDICLDTQLLQVGGCLCLTVGMHSLLQLVAGDALEQLGCPGASSQDQCTTHCASYTPDACHASLLAPALMILWLHLSHPPYLHPACCM
jgi:hypothetical protein